ncbi:MAG: hypothetical protein KAR42_03915 [candidate division Zixibacteria bacterium]|nr:hypothetical protein [candidate division Zixibacteria bacterium]
MPDNYKIIVVAICVFMLCAGNTVLLASNNTFSVTSYVPDKFTDFEWKVDGLLNLKGNTYDVDNESYDLSTYKFREQSNSSQTADFNTAIRYEYVSRPFNFSATSSVSGGIALTKGNQILNEDSNFLIQNGRFDDTNSRQFNYSVFQGIESRLYPSHEYFVELDVRLQQSRRYEPKNGTNFLFFYDNNTNDSLTKRSINERTERKLSEYSYTISGELTQGVGRVEYGLYSATAMYIVNELQAQGMLIRLLDFDEMMRLADLIHYYRNTHTNDNRLHKIESLTGILGYLKDIGAVGDSGPAVCLTVVDVWDYFPKEKRPFGFRVSIGIGMRYTYRKNDNSRKMEREYTNYYYNEINPSILDSVIVGPKSLSNYNNITKETKKLPYWVFGIEFHHPINLKWQLDFDGSANYYFDATDKEDGQRITYLPYFKKRGVIYSNSSDQWYEINLASVLTYILNSRTKAKLTVNYYYDHQNKTQHIAYLRDDVIVSESDEDTATRSSNTVKIGSQVEYRLTIPTTLIAGLDYIYRDNNLKLGSNLTEASTGDWSLSARLVHYLF